MKLSQTKHNFSAGNVCLFVCCLLNELLNFVMAFGRLPHRNIDYLSIETKLQKTDISNHHFVCPSIFGRTNYSQSKSL